MNLLVMQLVSEVEDAYNSKKFKENLIKETVSAMLLKHLEEKNITSTEYQSALEILEKYTLI